MTSEQIYWIMQADTIISACLVSGLVFTLIGGIATFGVMMEGNKQFVVLTLALAMIGLMFLAVATFMPSTKTQAVMYVVPAITKNERLAEDVPELYDLAVNRLKHVLEMKAEVMP